MTSQIVPALCAAVFVLSLVLTIVILHDTGYVGKKTNGSNSISGVISSSPVSKDMTMQYWPNNWKSVTTGWTNETKVVMFVKHLSGIKLSTGIKTLDGAEYLVNQYLPLIYGDKIILSSQNFVYECFDGIAIMDADGYGTYFTDIPYSRNAEEVKRQLPEYLKNYDVVPYEGKDNCGKEGSFKKLIDPNGMRFEYEEQK